jgi:hypothetical protein
MPGARWCIPGGHPRPAPTGRPARLLAWLAALGVLLAGFGQAPALELASQIDGRTNELRQSCPQTSATQAKEAATTTKNAATTSAELGTDNEPLGAAPASASSANRPAAEALTRSQANTTGQLTAATDVRQLAPVEERERLEHKRSLEFTTGE